MLVRCEYVHAKESLLVVVDNLLKPAPFTCLAMASSHFTRSSCVSS